MKDDLWRNWKENGTPIAPLTRKEKEVRRLMLHGITTDEKIAKYLCIAEGTAATHVDHIREKYQAHSRAELVAYLFHGLLIRLLGEVSVVTQEVS